MTKFQETIQKCTGSRGQILTLGPIEEAMREMEADRDRLDFVAKHWQLIVKSGSAFDRESIDGLMKNEIEKH